MAGRFAIKSGGSHKSVPTPGASPSWVLGSRPPDLRAPRIKPLSSGPGTRQYGKGMQAGTPNPGGAGFGQTGLGEDS
jgi:hypothetical protein